MTNHFEHKTETAKVEDSILNKTSDVAAEELSRSLMPMNASSYDACVKALARDTQQSAGTNVLSTDGGNTHLFSLSTEHDYSSFVFPKAGQSLSEIVKNDLEWEARGKVTAGDIKNGVQKYVETNHLGSADKIKAGEALIIPPNFW